MAIIDRSQLLKDEVTWLPESNVLTTSQMNALNEMVIANQVTDDDGLYYSEALCKGLKAIGLANKAKYSVDSGATKREKVGQTEIEFFEGASKGVWDAFIKSLSDICPLFGYTGLSSSRGGIKINSGGEVIVNPSCTTNETDYYL